MVENIGKFFLKGTQLMVTDPCYSKDNCENLLLAAPGEYDVWLAYKDNGVQAICVTATPEYFSEYEDMLYFVCNYEYNMKVDVDSGLCIIADYDQFKGTPEEYDHICEMSHDYYGFILNDYGAICSTGYGDGSYDVYTREENGVITAVLVEFIEDEDDEDDWTTYLNFSK